MRAVQIIDWSYCFLSYIFFIHVLIISIYIIIICSCRCICESLHFHIDNKDNISTYLQEKGRNILIVREVEKEVMNGIS